MKSEMEIREKLACIWKSDFENDTTKTCLIMLLEWILK